MLPSSPLRQLILVSLTAHMALAGARITTSLYALSLHASEFTVGTVIALFSLLPMLSAVVAGRMIDRIGIRRPMLCGSLAIAIGCAFPWLVPGLPILYVASMLIGTGFMVIQIAAQHTVGAASTDERRTANFSWLALGFSVSGFCGPVIAGFVIDHARHGVSYMVFGSCALVATVLIVFGRFGKMGDMPHVHADTPAPPEPHRALDLLCDSEMRRIYLIGILLSSAWDLFTFVLPLHGARLGFSASTIGLILGCFSMATFLVRLAMPTIGHRYSEWQVLTGALLLAVFCYALFPLMAQPLTLMAIAAILGLAVGSAQPNMLALLHQSAPPGRAAEAVGVRITIGNASQVLLPLAFGGAGATLGLSAVFWAMSVMIGTGVPLAWRKATAAK